jgi:Holliday junction resolvasome RuvABC endonuclease subunit
LPLPAPQSSRRTCGTSVPPIATGIAERKGALISAAAVGESFGGNLDTCDAADKAQAAFMVRALLKLTETPAHDAAGALAVAITHLESTAPGSPWQRERVVV